MRGGGLFVVDGQHRLEAARLRGDLTDLPCVVNVSGGAAEEAKAFVAINRTRKPLARFDLFRADLEAGDSHALAVMAVITKAGLSLAPHTNTTAWRPGMIGNLGGILRAWAKDGPAAVGLGLEALALAFPDEVLRFAGTIFPGCSAVFAAHPDAPPAVLAKLLSVHGQPCLAEWVRERREALACKWDEAARVEIVSLWEEDEAA